MDHRKIILDTFDSYCKKSGLAPATVSTQVMDDGKFYDRVKNGGGFTMKTYERVMKWFKASAKRTGKNGHANGK